MGRKCGNGGRFLLLPLDCWAIQDDSFLRASFPEASLKIRLKGHTIFASALRIYAVDMMLFAFAVDSLATPTVILLQAPWQVVVQHRPDLCMPICNALSLPDLILECSAWTPLDQ